MRTAPETNAILRLLLLPFAWILALGVLSACDTEGAGEEQGADVEDVTEEGVEDQEALDDEVGDEAAGIIDDPESFVGEQVTVSGEVNKVVGNNAFRIGGKDLGGEPLLVVSSKRSNVSQDELVEVTGTVREFDLAELENDFGVDLDDDAFTRFEGEHVIVADNVDRSPAGA